MNTIDTAIALALEVHHGQVNKHNGEPYILHPHRVAMMVKDRWLGDHTINLDYLVAIAWLHDALEDTELTLEQLMKTFPRDTIITSSVLALTKQKGETNQEYYRLIAGDTYAARVKSQDLRENFSRNHLIEDEETRLRMGKKYSMGMDMLREFA